MNTPTTSSSRASGSNTSPAFPTTPKSTGNPRHHHRTPNGGANGAARQRKAQSSSPQSLFPTFASSTMCSSPSAKNVPLPPMEWLNKLQVPCDFPSRPSSSNSTSSSTSSLLLSSPTQKSSSSSSNYMTMEDDESGRLLRVCPLQLIAAVVSA